jgi:AcrR family transcriptional regulator
MARIVNQEKHASKRNEILDAAQRFVYTKGYEQMTVQDILDDLAISKGAFYHYFDAEPAVLEALIERMQDEVEQILLPIVHEPHLSAVEKLRRFFATFDRLRSEEKPLVVNLLRVWYTDDNALVRQKVDAAILERRTPLLTEIIRQGIQDGDFTTAYPDQAAGIILNLLQGMGSTHARLLLTFQPDQDESRCVENIVLTHAAYMDAIERVLGIASNAFPRADIATAQAWITALQGN